MLISDRLESVGLTYSKGLSPSRTSIGFRKFDHLYLVVQEDTVCMTEYIHIFESYGHQPGTDVLVYILSVACKAAVKLYSHVGGGGGCHDMPSALNRFPHRADVLMSELLLLLL